MFLAPEIGTQIGRDPAAVVREMVKHLPATADYDEAYATFAELAEFACHCSLVNITENFWVPMKEQVFPKYIGTIDTEWKEEIVKVCQPELKM